MKTPLNPELALAPTFADESALIAVEGIREVIAHGDEWTLLGMGRTAQACAPGHGDIAAYMGRRIIHRAQEILPGVFDERVTLSSVVATLEQQLGVVSEEPPEA